MKQKKHKINLKEKVSQLFISKNPDNILEIEDFVKEGIGGFMIGKGGEIISYDQENLEGSSIRTLKNFTSKLRKISKKNKKIPLFLAIDGEGGNYFNRLKNISDLKSQRYYGEKFEKDYDIKYFQKEIEKFAKLMRKLDLNMNFAPLIDVAKKGYKGYVAEEKIKIRNKEKLTKSEIESANRSYSDNPEIVKTLAIEAMKIYQKNNIIPTLKHFPSYGILNEDQNPHIMLPVSNLSRKTILKHVELYKEAFNAGAMAIMTGHVTTAIDPSKPASLSKKNYSFLRKKLKFKGLVVVDELNMRGVHHYFGFKSLGKAAVDAIKANDIILISHPDTFIFMRNAILEAAKEYKEIREMVNDRYKRILKYKKKIGLIKNN